MCFGRFGRICHKGPLTTLGIIKCVTGVTVHCSGMWWPPNTVGGFLNTVCFMSLSGLTLYNFLSSMYHGPGYLPLKWKPENEGDIKYLQWCAVCQGYKAPRSHHCRKCGRCVLKMDHHCPWINNCVGWANHAHFITFLTFATLGCFHALIVLGCSFYRALFIKHYIYYGTGREPLVHLGMYGILILILALGLAIGVVVTVGMLLFIQVRAVIRNRTGIEDWILEKAIYRRKRADEQFIYPYNLGLWKNFCQVMNFYCAPVGDGITWPVIEGCDQYTLTREQMAQKKEKRERSKLYNIVLPASGYWFPITHGLKVCLNFPFNDEPRIKLSPGDTVLVTRWRKYWLFGEKVQDHNLSAEGTATRIRGWFPRRCAIECMETTSTNESNDIDRFSEKKQK